MCVDFCYSSHISPSYFETYGGQGGNIFATRGECATAEQRKGVGQTWGLVLFWICSCGNGDEEFGEISMKCWRWVYAEQKERPRGTETERNPQTFFFLLPSYYLASSQCAFSFHVTSMHQKSSWRHPQLLGRIKSQPQHQDLALPLKLPTEMNTSSVLSELVSTILGMANCAINYPNTQTRK